MGTNPTAHAPGPLIKENIRICFTFAIKLLVKLQHNQIYQFQQKTNYLFAYPTCEHKDKTENSVIFREEIAH